MSSPVACRVCGYPGEHLPCPKCGSGSHPVPGSDLGTTPPPPGVPALSLPRQEAPPRHPLPRLPGYEVLAYLGTQGPISLYEARQTRLRRTVLLNLLPEQSVPEDAKNGFRYDAQILTRLGNPHLAPILDIGECEKGFYFTTEHYPSTLLELLKHQSPQPQQVILWVEQLARGVQAAHERGLVHGQIDASCVFFTDDGTIKLAGFGLNRLFGELPGGIGEDIAALGELLNRSSPHPLPVSLQVIYEKSRSAAYSTARELVNDLTWLRAGESIPPPTASTPRPRPRRRLSRLLVPTLLSAVVLGFVLIGAYLLGRNNMHLSYPVDLAQAELWICPRSAGFENGPGMSRRSEGWLRRHPGVTRVESCLIRRANWRIGHGPPISVLILGGECQGTPLGPIGILNESLREKLQLPGQVIVCSGDLATLGVADEPPTQPRIGTHTVQIAEVVQYPSSTLGPLVFCSLATAQHLLNVPSEEISFLLAKCDRPARARQVVQMIYQENDDVRAYTREQLALRLQLGWWYSSRSVWIWAISSLLLLGLAGWLLGLAAQRSRLERPWVVVVVLAFLLTLSVASILHVALERSLMPILDAIAVLAGCLLALIGVLNSRRVARLAKMERDRQYPSLLKERGSKKLFQ